ncbi:putative glycosyl hydrolase [Actinoplanes missouriensis 431]|uniref:Endoglucanase n=1 Tax=Actinoplanes missouriensis (strain ATCC 14538 / DSM 43046 / CBS 188.64 / JCM 3121 / NBRC 102363 / NCIMB 12654 / NRRL B-3342 / UNCC 431) TaxID=512565 RepID=I0HB19_ACTM4|nr:cellulase family glycosylhydrolase [Actinoplanes missouriensis]BAL90206.1 putative glycosyl hydrolase [Actinoplanes missouriensis 431]
MSSRLRKAWLVFLAAALAVTGAVYGVTRPASADVTAELTAPQLVADMGAGWNLGNTLEASVNGIPGETAWGNPVVTQAFIDKVRAAGFRTIRIPVSYLGHIGAAPDYTVNAAWLNRIKEVVDYAHSRGLYVLINMHGDGYKTVSGSWLICDASSQTAIREKYQKVWQQVAIRFQSYDEHLIFESMNENFDGQYGNPTQPCYSNINAYNQIFVDTVRRTGGVNASRWLLVPGWNTNIDYTAGNYGFVIPTDQYRSTTIPAAEQRLMISVHYYDPWDFTGTEDGTITQWGAGATNPAKKSVWGQEDFLDGQMKKMHDTFVTRGYPVFVGEYGSIDKTTYDSASNRYRADYARAVVTAAKKYGAATAYWDNGWNGQHGFGLFDRSSGAVTQPGIVNAIMSAVGTQPSSSPSASTSPSASASPSPSTSPSTSPGTCRVTSAVNAWNTGLTNSITIANTGSTAINGWRLTFTLAGGQAITSGWSATYSPSSGTVTATNASYNGAIPAGGSVSIGYQAGHTGNAAAPTGFTLNGATCN